MTHFLSKALAFIDVDYLSFIFRKRDNACGHVLNVFSRHLVILWYTMLSDFPPFKAGYKNMWLLSVINEWKNVKFFKLK